MREFQMVSPATADLYEKFTYPRFRHLLRQANQDSIVAVAILSCGQPAGLCLVEIDEPRKMASIRSLFIVAHLRKTGLGRELLLVAEKKVQDKGCQVLAIRYNTAQSSSSPIQTMLQRCSGWQEPQLVMEQSKMDLCSLAKEKWIYRIQLSPTYSIIPWPPAGSVVLEELREQTWYPAYASPFMEHSLIIHRPTSFLLYRKEEIVGWAITRQFQPDTIVVSTLFVKEELQGTGRGIMLFAETAKALFLAQIPYAVFILLHESHNSNQPLLQFSERHLKPFSSPLSKTWQTYKRIVGRMKGVYVYVLDPTEV